MLVDRLVVLVEEPSMEAALEYLLPKIVRQGIRIEIRQFQCKSELLKRLPQRLAAYRQWLPESARIAVLVDRDDDDCQDLKQRLDAICTSAGLATRSQPVNGTVQVINRIAVEELEAWFFGDWEAVCHAYGRADRRIPGKAAYREPDAIAGGTWEALERELQKRSYFASGLRKVELARSVAQHMTPSMNRSPSFRSFRDAVGSL